MFKLSDDYYQRKNYLKHGQVPTQSVMKEKIMVPLANVYFKSMNPNLKFLAGLEPPMKGGGSDWYVPPSELLEGRAVMKPIKKSYLSKLSFNGINDFGENLVAHHHSLIEEEKKKALLESDNNWKETIIFRCQQQWEDTSKEAAKNNTNKIREAVHEFSVMYSTSLTKIESVLQDATFDEIKRIKEETYQKMRIKFKTLVEQQARILYDKYTEKLNTEKAKLKTAFIEDLEQIRTNMCQQLHDINVEKHTVIEKIRHFMECQNLACRVYVALKEREQCANEIDVSKHQHEKKMKVLKEEMAMKDFEITLEIEKKRKRDEYIKIWQKKVCEVIKKFQLFVLYCLKSLPEHADFFIKLEKLMLLQFNEAIEEPSAESLFVTEDEKVRTPTPPPHPFFLFCDQGYKPNIDKDLCPKHCTSSASQLPVVVVNKRCIYAACDSFEMYINKVKEYIHGKQRDAADFEDDHDYSYDVPVTFTLSKQLEELKLQSSLFNLLQKEHPNLRNVETECCICRVPHCFCSRLLATKLSSEIELIKKETSLHPTPSGNKIEGRILELEHEREPKWESFMEYVETRKCKCRKTVKKNLQEHLPAYMKNVSIFERPELPDYEPCSLATLKQLVKKAQRKHSPPEAVVVASKTRDACTQYSEIEFDLLCNCFSEDEVQRFINDLHKEHRYGELKFIDGSITDSYLEKRSSSFAMDRAYSLRNLMHDSPELEEIFKKRDCIF